jgi:hypothetical protein
MAITPIGWVLFIVGPLLMIARPRWLYIATVFFLPFTATGIVNVGSGVDASAIQVSMYFGSLVILRHMTGFLCKGKLPFPRAGRASLIWLGLFIAIVAVSLVMPIWIDGHLQIPAQNLGDLTSQPLHLSSHNITGVLYMIYGYLFTYLVAILNRNPEILRLSFKSFVVGSAFAAVWAIVEFACKISGIEYPAMIFNTGTAVSTMGYRQFLADGVFRISSVAVEPSIFAQTLLVALSIYLPFIFGTSILFGKVLDRWLFALLLAVLCMTTSSTAYVGILLIFIFVLALFSFRGILKPVHLAIPLTGFVVAALLYATVPAAQQILDTALLSKSGGYSALERLMTISNSYDMFRKYPVLGIGWASITSHDLIVNILANAGILGLSFFSVAMYSIFRDLYRSLKSRSKSLRVSGLMQVDFALYIALAVMLATSILSGFLNTFSFFWFILGLAVAGSNIKITVREPPQ